MDDSLGISLNRFDPKAMLIASRALSAARPALIAFLITRGAELGGGMAEPISFCNVLFVGNLSAALLVGFWFGFGTIIRELRGLNGKALMGLFINGCLATLLSALIFIGLRYTTVTNAVLLGRVGPVLFAIGGALFLGKKVKVLEWVGFSLIIVGSLAIALKSSGFTINLGDLLILLSTVVFSVSSLVNRLMVAKAATLSSVVFSRNLLSSVIFFFIALHVYGPHHFGDSFSGRLWIIMSIYSLVVIVFAQFLWYASADNLDSRTVGQLTVISPIFGVAYAFLLNGERPSGVQTLSLIVVILGVLISSLGGLKKSESKREMMMNEPENAASAP